MNIRNATKEDLEVIDEIYYEAKKIMRRNGNLNQWPDYYPSEELLLDDIDKKQLYLVEDDNNQAIAVFALIAGVDKTYEYIEDGEWLKDGDYLALHRIGKKDGKGVFDKIINFALSKNEHLRIDTHRDNTIMQHLLLKYNFRYCGIIYVDVEYDNARLAYEHI